LRGEKQKSILAKTLLYSVIQLVVVVVKSSIVSIITVVVVVVKLDTSAKRKMKVANAKAWS